MKFSAYSQVGGGMVLINIAQIAGAYEEEGNTRVLLVGGSDFLLAISFKDFQESVEFFARPT